MGLRCDKMGQDGCRILVGTDLPDVTENLPARIREPVGGSICLAIYYVTMKDQSP